MVSFKQNVAVFFATGFGSGHLPIAPGSWASAIIAVAGWWLVDMPLGWYVVLVATLFFISVWAVGLADPHFASLTKKSHDNKQIVIDEWVGQLLALLPVFYFGKSLVILTLGLFLFRVFDTAKLGLAKYFDEQGSHWGVVLDDVFASIHAAIFFSLFLWIAQQTESLQFVFKI